MRLRVCRSIWEVKMQKHLDEKTTINLGSYYTPKKIVDIAYRLLNKRVYLKNYTFLDSSCGSGEFFCQDLKFIGADIDKTALDLCHANAKLIQANSLQNVSRKKFGIKSSDKLIIIGNPPYNDKTSLIKNNVKQVLFKVDDDLKHRDLGISFLRSYEKLSPDFICVLHPFSYLVKKTNFNALKNFKNKYMLKDAVIISSCEFTPKSSTYFPIIIALYEKSPKAMSYDDIMQFNFKTIEGYKFCINDFDFISNYVKKYPNLSEKKEAVAYFHTLRDINALKRNQTFMNKITSNSIKVFKDNLKYYCYIDFFKRYCLKLPYHFGNFDVFIDNDKFLKIQKEFENSFYKKNYNLKKIDNYFSDLFRRYL